MRHTLGMSMLCCNPDFMHKVYLGQKDFFTYEYSRMRVYPGGRQ